MEEIAAADPAAIGKPPSSLCSLFSNHGLVLVCIARDANSRLRDIADLIGITERAVFNIIRDLQDAQMVQWTKLGRRNVYTVSESADLGHALVHDTTVGQLLPVVNHPARE